MRILQLHRHESYVKTYFSQRQADADTSHIYIILHLCFLTRALRALLSVYAQSVEHRSHNPRGMGSNLIRDEASWSNRQGNRQSTPG